MILTSPTENVIVVSFLKVWLSAVWAGPITSHTTKLPTSLIESLLLMVLC
jgi:hypothetical protein